MPHWPAIALKVAISGSMLIAGPAKASSQFINADPPNRPIRRGNGDHADHESDGAGQGGRARRIAAVEGGNAGGHGERQGRGGSHRKLPAGSTHGIGEAGGEVAIEAGYRRQAGHKA
jgi:hypothetical protein